MCMKKFSPRKGMKQVPSIIFAIAGLFLLSVTGFLLSDPGRKLWNPQPQAAVPCGYGTYSSGHCSNSLCTTALGTTNLGNKCSGGNPKSGYHVTKCRIPGDHSESIVDCCTTGNPTGSSCPGSTTTTPTPTPTPTAHYCSTYGTFPRNSCTNLQCPTGRYCATRLLTGAVATFCLSRTSTSDQMMSCCAAGYILNSAGTSCINGATTPTPSPTPSPTLRDCSWGSYPIGTCSNTSCGTNMGYDCRGEQVYNALRRKCKNLTGTGSSQKEEIVDCCGTNAHVAGSSGSYYCQANVTSSPTPNPTQCTYGTYEGVSMCTANAACPSGRSCTSWGAVSNADSNAKKCRSVSGSTVQIMDCCPVGQTLNSAKTACVSTTNPTSTPQLTGNPTNPPISTISSTHTPSPTVTPTPSNPTQSPTGTNTPTVSGTGSPTVPQTTTTGSPTGSGTPTGTGTPTSSIPPTTYPSTPRTPSVTHTPGETGFAEDVLLYIGGALYIIGVLAFVGARYIGAGKSRLPV